MGVICCLASKHIKEIGHKQFDQGHIGFLSKSYFPSTQLGLQLSVSCSGHGFNHSICKKKIWRMKILKTQMDIINGCYNLIQGLFGSSSSLDLEQIHLKTPNQLLQVSLLLSFPFLPLLSFAAVRGPFCDSSVVDY